MEEIRGVYVRGGKKKRKKGKKRKRKENEKKETCIWMKPNKIMGKIK